MRTIIQFKRAIIILLVMAIAVLMAGCSLGAEEPKPQRVSAEQERPPQRTEAWAEKFAKEYWALADGRLFMKLFDLLLPSDRRLIDRDRFFDRQFQENEFNMGTEIVDVAIDGRAATVTLETEMDPTHSTVRATHQQRLVWRGSRWYVKLTPAALLSYGAEPKELGIEPVKAGEQVSLSALSVAVERAGAITKGGQYYVYTDLSLTNNSDRASNISVRDYFVLSGSEQANSQPSEALGAPLQVALEPGQTSEIRIDFPTSRSNEPKFQLLVGQGSQLFLLPLDI